MGYKIMKDKVLESRDMWRVVRCGKNLRIEGDPRGRGNYYYHIDQDRVNELDWIRHIGGKVWGTPPSMAALEYFIDKIKGGAYG